MSTHRDDDRTMSDLLAQHIAVLEYEGARPSTIRGRRRCILRLHDDLPHGVLYATTEQLQAWLAYERWDRWTRYTYYSHLAGFYAWLQSIGVRPDNPMDGIRRPKAPDCIPRPATEEQVRAALAAPEPIRTAAMLAYYQGMRRSEITACCREHIGPEITLIPLAKGGQTQTVPTHPAVWEHVRDLPDGPVVTERGRPVSPDRLNTIVRRWAQRAGIAQPGDRWGLHRLRHSFGTEIQRTTRDIRITQECLRHRSIRSTQIYTAVTDEQRRAAIAMLPRIEPRPGGVRPGPTAAA